MYFMKKSLLSVVFFALAGLIPANAQYTFSLNASWSGNCGGYTAQLNQTIDKYKSQAISGFPTRELCEQGRIMCNQVLTHIAVVSGLKTTNCKINYTTTPCTGRPMAGTVGTLNALGVSQGTSFYSANSANEIQNWSSDNIERMLALDKRVNSFEPTSLSTGDENYDNARTFVSLDMRPGGSSMINQEYYHQYSEEEWANTFEKQLLDEFHTEYKELTGIDIKDVLAKDSKTAEDLKLIDDYNQFKLAIASEEIKFKDMAILSALEYIDANTSLGEYTGYHSLEETDLPDNSPLHNLAQTIEKLNDKLFGITGFHAGFYYNEQTNEYTVAFRGTEKSISDVYADATQGGGHVPKQYKMAMEIGDVIRQIKEQNPDIVINITGHSLGGGLATVAGKVSGCQTIVFNPAGVHPNTVEYVKQKETYVYKDFNIKVISTHDDPLTNVQEGKGRFKVGSLDVDAQVIKLGVKAIAYGGAMKITKQHQKALDFATNALPEATGNKRYISTEEGHSIEPMANYYIRRVEVANIREEGFGNVHIYVKD